MRHLLLPAFGLGLLPALAFGYPGGTPSYVTDLAPFCASCHSSLSLDSLAGAPEKRAEAELASHKHLAKIRAAKAGSPYAKLTAEQREELIQGIERIDAASSVEIVVPQQLKPGQEFEVTLTARGGGGPVVGLALVDAPHRWQARPAASAGWRIVDRPTVTGPDGQIQTRFLDGRRPDLAPGISYVNVYGIEADPGAGSFSTVQVTYRLRAPVEAGTYPLAAAFLYGTEKGSPHGAVETLQGRAPIGGFGASAGRVRFSEVVQIRVE